MAGMFNPFMSPDRPQIAPLGGGNDFLATPYGTMNQLSSPESVQSGVRDAQKLLGGSGSGAGAGSAGGAAAGAAPAALAGLGGAAAAGEAASGVGSLVSAMGGAEGAAAGLEALGAGGI